MNKYIFVDESIGRKDFIPMIGAISVSRINFDKKFEVSQRDDERISKFSFSEIINGLHDTGVDRQRVVDQYSAWVTESINNLKNDLVLNIIIYQKAYDNPISERREHMVYNIFPERLIYGLLKYDSNFFETKTSIYLDSHNKYFEYNIIEYLSKHLNAYSLYRGYKYEVVDVGIVNKKTLSDYHNINTYHISSIKEQITALDRELYSTKSNLSIEKDIDKRRTVENKLIDIRGRKQKLEKLKLDHERKYQKEKIQSEKYSYGISLIDFLLNAVRAILIFNDKKDNHQSIPVPLAKKVNFVLGVMDVIFNESFQKNVNIFEWVGNDKMKKIDFCEQIYTFQRLTAEEGWYKK